MKELIFDSLTLYYGLDWLAFISGLSGMYLITRKSRWGFILSAICCMCGFAVAFIGHQFGFLPYNFLLMLIMVKGFFKWGREHRIPGSA